LVKRQTQVLDKLNFAKGDEKLELQKELQTVVLEKAAIRISLYKLGERSYKV